MDEDHRWRVTVKAVYLPEEGADQKHAAEESVRRILGRVADAAPSYEWHAGDVTVTVEVWAPSEPSALYTGAALILEALPTPPLTTIVEFRARRLMWEPAHGLARAQPREG